MSQEEKQLVLKDLSARLLCGVKVSITAHNLDYEEDFGKTIIADLMGIQTAKDDDGITHTCFITCYDEYKTQGNDIETIKPYLRSLLTMTEEEKEEQSKIVMQSMSCSLDNSESATTMLNDWLLSKHFDVRGLISKGLALEAPKDMYES